MSKKTINISLALRLNERYDHRCAIGIVRYSRDKENWRLFGSESLFFTDPERYRNAPDGIIARITNRQELARLKAYNVPLVDIAGSYRDPSLFQAINDDFETGIIAASHFLVRGFHNFAYLGINDMLWSENRYAGFSHEVKRTIGADVSVFTIGTSWLRRDYNPSRLIRWLKKLPLPCAVMTANDLIGYRAAMAASFAGLAVPEQLSVLGVDNEDLYCELSQPKLTSIACDCEAIGAEAAALLDRILQESEPAKRVVVPPGAVMARESTSITIGEDSLVREIKIYIRANINKGMNVAEVAACFPLSRRSLERRFRSVEGMTMHEAIEDARLEKACQLLQSGLNATKAGYESGFVSIQHFHHVFKKRFHVTPTQYAGKGKKGQ